MHTVHTPALTEERPGVLSFSGARMALMDIEAGFWGLRRQIEALAGRRLTDAVLQQAGANGGASFARAFTGRTPDMDAATAFRDCVAAYQAAGFGHFTIEELEWPIGRVVIIGDETTESWMARRHGQTPNGSMCAYTAGVLVGFVNVLSERRDVVCVEHTCQADGAEACVFELLPAGTTNGDPVVTFDPDPALSRQLNLLELLFDRMPMGIVIVDRDYRVRRFNPTWADFTERRTPSSANKVVPGVSLFELAPDAEEELRTTFAPAMAGETVRYDATPLPLGDTVSYWDTVLTPLVEDGEVVGVLNVTIDVTERVEAEEEVRRHRDHLEHMVAQRTAELRASNQRLQEEVAHRKHVEDELRKERNFNDAVLDTAGAIVVVLDRDGRIVRFNRASEELSGYTHEEVEGKYVWDLFLLPEEVDEVKAVFERLRAGEFPFHSENYWQTKDGEARLLSWSSTALLDADGEVAYVVGTGIDVTEQRRTEEALQQAHDKLEQRVEERTTELREANEQLRDEIAERRRAEHALQESQRTLTTLMSNLPGMAYRCRNDANWTMEFVSEGSFDLTGYAPEALVGTSGIAYGALIHPEDRDMVWDIVQAALSEDRSYQLTYRISTADGDEKWVWEQGRGVPAAPGTDPVALEGFITDITERVMAQRDLEQRVEERTRELSTLLDVSHEVNATLELETLLDMILGELKTVVDYDGASLMTLNDDVLEMLAYHGPIPQDEALGYRFTLDDAGANSRVIQRREPVVIPDVLADDELAHAFQQTAGSDLDSAFHYMRCWMGVPLISKGDVIGMLSLDHHEPAYYDDAQGKLVMAFANQVVVALENARLHSEVRQRADEAQTLFTVQRAVTSRLDPDAVLQLIADEARRLTDARRTVIFMRDGNDLEVSVVSGEESPDMLGYRLPVGDSLTGASLTTGQPFRCNDVPNDTRLNRSIIDKSPIQTLLTVPLISGSKGIGAIAVSNKEEGVFTDEDERVLTMLASGAVVALENARLYQQEQERRRESEQRRQIAEGLRDILAVLNSNLPLNQTLEAIVKQATRLLGTDAGAIYHFDRYQAKLEASANLPDDMSRADAFALTPSEELRAVLNREPAAIPDLTQVQSTELTYAKSLKENYGAMLTVPLVVRDEIYGTLTLFYEQPRRQQFSDDELQLAVAFGDQAALAIENANLFVRLEQRTKELASLYRADEELYGSLQLEQVLQSLVDVAVNIMHVDKSSVMIWDAEKEQHVARATHGFRSDTLASRAFAAGEGVIGAAAQRNEPIVVEDVSTNPDVITDVTEAESIRAFMHVPIEVDGSVFGVFNVNYVDEHHFTDEEQRLIVALAQRAGLAIENARLYERAQRAAAVDERQRLARELHDAVTQTLFSASLIAEVLPQIWEQDQEEGRSFLQELRQLTRGALAEMRTLLLELRPSALLEADLDELLQQLGRAVTGRTGIPVAVEIDAACEVPAEVHVALYRIAQEALNNVVKHSGASSATVQLRACECSHAGSVALHITDDGRGFDPDSVPGDHLGLTIMQERADSIGATLTVESSPGAGTEIVAAWSPEEGEDE